jgi:hypothetical protein
MIQYSDNFPDAEYDPYALAIGKFGLNWNFLQYALCELFSIVTLEKTPQVGDRVNHVPIKIWHSLRSDRAQREMLKAAIESSHLSQRNDLVRNRSLWPAVASSDSAKCLSNGDSGCGSTAGAGHTRAGLWPGLYLMPFTMNETGL